MRVVRQGEFYKASRITGPHHNFLAMAFGPPGAAKGYDVEVLNLSHGRELHMHPNDVLDAVLEGLQRANAKLGTDFAVCHIKYVADDTPSRDAYIILAERITESMAEASTTKT